MSVNEIAIKAVESNTVRQYLESINHKFSIKEQISIIFNSNLELDYKLKIFKDLVNSDETSKNTKIKLEIMISNIEKFYECLNNYENNALMFFDEDGEAKTIKNLDRLRKYIKEHNDIVDLANIHVIDLNTSETKYSLGLNSELNIIWYNPYSRDNYEHTSLEDYYVDVPNQFKVGDLVRMCNSTDKYVVIQDSEIPEHLKSKCDFFDSCITVVPKSVFTDNSKSYKDQIEEIFKNRIKHMESNEPILDILSKEHEHFPIIFVEKI